VGALNDLIQDVEIPKMARVHQHFLATQLQDVEKALRTQLSRPAVAQAIRPGQRIAITAGSRGIDNMPLVLRTVAEFVRSRGAQPFLVPAMGSHGGATAQGQEEILRSYGITQKSTGAPVLATMEVAEVCRLSDGSPVYLDANAFAADGIIVVNRVKYHTLFRGRYESGLMKMMAVGLGKQRGAEQIHRCGPAQIAGRVEDTARAILRRCRICFGVALVENAFDKTCDLQVLTPEEIPLREPELLEKSRQQMPRIYFENLDLLIVDRIGKNISGSGMDPNITGTFTRESGIPGTGRAKRITVLDLTAETHGCGLGVGMADTTTRRLYDAFSFEATYPNALTTSVLESARIPAVFDNQRLAIQAAIRTILGVAPQQLRVVRIRDTLHLEEIQISQALAQEALDHPGVELVSAFAPLPFNAQGNLFE
jgi:hypothetical protein